MYDSEKRARRIKRRGRGKRYVKVIGLIRGGNPAG
jgi:hypothetical protein